MEYLKVIESSAMETQHCFLRIFALPMSLPKILSALQSAFKALDVFVRFFFNLIFSTDFHKSHQ